ncbi:TIGR03643 family protein [uncultured Shewanella sp.]|uniref:TIGR03643 family protein n=1 Tax=uncultured Shewanella sp. TaxID=173975 RepID=UPI002612A980|nr:TIGR03643 family protein [uncultured Shewanella sp.]
MAWEDRTSFEAIAHHFGVNESAVIQFMRKNLKCSSFNLWRSRVSARNTKHLKLRASSVNRAYCNTQYKM